MGKLKSAALAAIEHASRENYKCTLVYVDYRDELSDKQVQWLFDDDDESHDRLWESLVDWESESRWEGMRSEMRDLLACGDDAPDRLQDKHPMLYEQLEELISCGDDSNIIADLLRNTKSMFFRVELGTSVGPGEELDMDDEFALLKEIGFYIGDDKPVTAFDVDEGAHLVATIRHNVDQLRTLVGEQQYYGGEFVVGVYCDVETMLSLHKYGGKITDPQVFIWDGLNGSCWDEQFKGDVTVPAERVTVDSTSGKYGIDGICGLSTTAFHQTVTPNPKPAEEVAA